MTGENSIYSHHVFLFPFRWDVGKKSFAERLNRSSFISLLNERWQPSTYYEKDPITYYNSANYFYEFARKAIYSFDGNDSTVINYHFDRQGKEYNYLIERLTGINPESTRIYELSVQHIGLNIYDTGIGILTFNLVNKKDDQQSFENILAINDFGRRMYPQFLDTSAKGKDEEDRNLIQQTQLAFLAKSITIISKDESDIVFKETFEDYYSEEKLKQRISGNSSNLPNTPKSIARFLGTKIGTTEHTSADAKQVTIRPILDDRNFTLCWYGNDEELKKVNQWNSTDKAYSYLDFDASDQWLKYVFVDNSSNTIQSKAMRPTLAAKHTYDRWIEGGSLYGLSRYSLVCLSTREWFPTNILRKQIGGGVYFEMAQLLLAQRASIIRFSDEATSLASKKFEPQEAQKLHEQYMRFVNRLYFREATAQEQGIEMYIQLSEFMEISRDVNNLNREIDELHQFVSMEEQEIQTKQATNLTKVATIMLPATLLTGVLGMNTIDSNKLPEFLISSKPQWPFFLSLGLVFILSITFIWGLNSVFQLGISFKKKKS